MAVWVRTIHVMAYTSIHINIIFVVNEYDFWAPNDFHSSLIYEQLQMGLFPLSLLLLRLLSNSEMNLKPSFVPPLVTRTLSLGNSTPSLSL